MDSLTQIVLGGALAAAIAPPRHRRAALLAGAALGTLPDLDSLPIALLTDDPVALMTLHRGASHSLFVLPLLGWLAWAFFRRLGGRVAESPKRWFWAIQAVLLTHPLLDALTVYGTQLLWPLPLRPVMWSSVFIIDPLYTVWLLAACIAAFFLRERVAAQRALVAGLVLSTAYLGWSLIAKAVVEREAGRALAAMGLADAPRFSVPTPLNTLLWRVVVMTPGGYVEGFRSLVVDAGPMEFRGHPSNAQALAEAREVPAVRRLAWFNHGFMRAQVVDGELVLSDLRMGSEPDYFFSYAVARREGDGWQAIAPPRQLELQRDFGPLWSATWHRIWNEPQGGSRPAASPEDDGGSRPALRSGSSASDRQQHASGFRRALLPCSCGSDGSRDGFTVKASRLPSLPQDQARRTGEERRQVHFSMPDGVGGVNGLPGRGQVQAGTDSRRALPTCQAMRSKCLSHVPQQPPHMSASG